jgi:hypothetical protein
MAGSRETPGADGLRPGLAMYMSGPFERGRLSFARTLASLAERGWLEISAGEAAGATVRLLPAPGAPLARSEELVLERVRACSRAMPTVPLSVVNDLTGEEGRPWLRAFHRALAAEALAAGLTRRRMRSALRYPVMLLAGLLGAALGASVHTDRPVAAASAGLAAFILASLVTAFLTATRPTPFGRQIADWARGQASQTSISPPESPASPEALLRQDGKPLPANQAWSSYTGTWRVVAVGQPILPSRGRPARLLRSLYATVVLTIPFALAGPPTFHGVRGLAIAAVPAALFVLYAALFWLPAHVRRLRHPRRAVYRGQVVKKWIQSDGSDDDATLYCCSVDGGGEQAATHLVARDAHSELGLGDVVEVVHSPRWQVLRRITRVG